MTYRLRNIGIAIVLAVVAALDDVLRHELQAERPATKETCLSTSPHMTSLGTSGADVAQGGGLRVEQVPRRSVVPGAISQPDQIADKVAVEAIYAGEQVSTQRFRSVQEQGIQAQLKGNLRPPGARSATQLLNGTLKDGDHVDVLGTWLFPERGSNHISRVLLRNLLVLEAPATNDVEQAEQQPEPRVHRDARLDGLAGHEVLVAREQRRVVAPAPAGQGSVRQPGGSQQLQDQRGRRPQRTAARPREGGQ